MTTLETTQRRELSSVTLRGGLLRPANHVFIRLHEVGGKYRPTEIYEVGTSLSWYPRLAEAAIDNHVFDRSQAERWQNVLTGKYPLLDQLGEDLQAQYSDLLTHNTTVDVHRASNGEIDFASVSFRSAQGQAHFKTVELVPHRRVIAPAYTYSFASA